MHEMFFYLSKSLLTSPEHNELFIRYPHGVSLDGRSEDAYLVSPAGQELLRVQVSLYRCHDTGMIQSQ